MFGEVREVTAAARAAVCLCRRDLPREEGSVPVTVALGRPGPPPLLRRPRGSRGDRGGSGAAPGPGAGAGYQQPTNWPSGV